MAPDLDDRDDLTPPTMPGVAPECRYTDEVAAYHAETCPCGRPPHRCLNTEYNVLCYRAGLRQGARLYRQGLVRGRR